jgi:hypothetical protein
LLEMPLVAAASPALERPRAGRRGAAMRGAAAIVPCARDAGSA